MNMYAPVLAVLAMTVIAGCSERQEPGPAEKAGKQIDQAMEKAGQQTQQAMRKADDYASQKIKEAGQTIERAGEELKK